MVLPPDGHVHSEWSWDAPAGSMEQSCARAVELGLTSIAFTEHADFTNWVIEPTVKAQMLRLNAALPGPDDRFTPLPLDTEAYMACVLRCRERFPELRILSGVELGEPHWQRDEVDALLSTGGIDRVLGAVHSVEVDGTWMVDHLFDRLQLGELMRGYLAEACKLAESSAPFSVLAHIDYPVCPGRYLDDAWRQRASCRVRALDRKTRLD